MDTPSVFGVLFALYIMLGLPINLFVAYIVKKRTFARYTYRLTLLFGVLGAILACLIKMNTERLPYGLNGSTK